ncbi:SdrD B-like domain-containing protein [Corynebacterium lehmanniae]
MNFFDANGNPLPAIKENIAQTADRRIQVWKDSDQGGDSSQDTGGSYYTVDEENPNRPQDPNEVLWQADASWYYNPTTKTGDTWIEDGTIIELTHQTENGDCVQDPNYTVDLNDQSFANVSARVAPRPTEATAEFEWAIHEVIGDYVWYDTNRDGIQGADERGAAKVEVTVTSADGQWTTTTTTDENGSYRVIVPSPGTYNVEFAVPEGYEPTGTNVEGSTPENDSNGASTTVTVSEGQDDLNLDLGLVEPVPDPKPELASVGDRVWIDANRNGVQDEGEENLAGVNVTVTPPAGSDEQARTATTDADGKWRIDELTPGVEYTVSFELPEGYKATDALVGEDRGVDSNGLRSTVTLKPGEFNDTYDLGVFQPASIGDFVWEDTNGDGIQDDGELAVPNTIVRVTGPNGETHTTATDKDGKWSVDGLTPGVEYTVEFTPPAGYQVTKTEQGEDRRKDSNPLSSAVSLKPGENNTTYDLGLVKPASIGDRVWVDENENGIQDENEKNGVPNARVTVTAPEGVDEQPRTTTTDDKGNWRIDGLTPGVEYTVTFELPEGVSATKSLVGDDRGVDSNELSTKITLESDQHDPTFDLGVVPASIGDRVWLDEGDEEKVGRADGIQNDGEGGIADVVVRVSRPGEEVRETKTGADGTWKIEGLTPGVDDYRVEFDAPSGYRISPTKAGDAAVDSNGLSDKVAALKSGEFNDTYDLGLFIDVPETTTVTTPVPTVETTTVPTPCDCSPTTVPKTVTSKVPVPTTKTQSVPTTLTTKVPVPTTLTTEVPVPTTKTQAVPTTLTTQVPVPTTLTTEVPVPTTVTSEVPVPTTVPTTTTQAVPTTVEKPVPVPTTVRSTTTAEAPKRGTIGDKVWEDTNGDGKEDPDEKTGIPNVPVVIVDKDGNEVTRTVTDKDGNWKVDVEPGEYTVRYEPGDRTPSDPEQVKRTVTIKPGEKRDDIDLGVLPSGSVGDRVWNDEDGDGEQGEDEKGIPNVIVEVSREGEPTRTTHTDENGDWKIEGLNPNAEYDIRSIKPEGWEVTGKVPGSDESSLVSKVTVKPNEYNDSYDLGLKKVDPGCDCEPVKPGTIGDRVWIDLNGNGKQDPNETEGAPDVTVIVRDKDGNEVTRTVTDEDGNWKVNVEPGDYEIEYRPRDWKPTDPKRVTQKVTVEEGKEYLDLDLGVQKPKPGEPTPPTGEPEPDPEKGSSTETLDRCVANAVRSPLLYLVPVALLGAFGGEIARPYMGAINEQVNQINTQFQEAMRRNSPDWGHGGRGGRDNDQFAELRGQIDAANRRIAELGQDPNVQRFGTVAAGIIGLIAAGGVLYDWCSNEKGEAFTSIGGSSAKESDAEGRQSSNEETA